MMINKTSNYRRPIQMEKNVVCKIQKRKNAKKITLSIDEFGKVLLTIPTNITYKQGRKFALKNKQWIYEKLNILHKNKVGGLLQKGDVKDYQANKEKARALVLSRIEALNRKNKFKFNKVFIRNQKKRWGSCSDKRNLNFNYRIIYLPKKLQDYLIVHELCHLKEMNHSRKYWELVGKSITNHKELSKLLKKI